MADRPWIPTDLSNLQLWIDPSDVSTWHEVTSSGGGSNPTINWGVADLSGIFGGSYRGYYSGIGGSISAEPISGFSTLAILDDGSANIYIYVSGDATASVSVGSSLTIDSNTFPVGGVSYASGATTITAIAPVVTTIGTHTLNVGSGTATTYQIYDKSGNNNHFRSFDNNTIAYRTQNSLRAIDFADNIYKRLVCTTTNLNSITNGYHSTFTAGGIDVNNRNMLFSITTASAESAFFATRKEDGALGTWSYYHSDYYGLSSYTSGLISRANTVSSFVKGRGGANNYNGYQTGNLDMSAGGGAADFVAANVTIGGMVAATSITLDGWVGDVIIYNVTLDLADQQKVEGYLAHKWGLQGDLPGAHPYKSAPPVVTIADPDPPVISTPTSITVSEGANLNVVLTADKTITSWALVGGTDQAKFEISGSTLRWLGNGTKSYDSPDDSDTNNTYIVQVEATDIDGLTSTITITVTVTEAAFKITFRNPGSEFNLKLSDVVGPSNIIANAALIEAADTLAASAAVKITGQAALTETNDTISSVSTNRVTAQGSLSEGADTLTSTALVKVLAVSNLTEADDTLSGLLVVAAPTIVASASLSESDDTIVSIAAVKVSTQSSLLEEDDIITASSTVLVRASTALTEDNDVLVSTTELDVSATANLTEADDTLTGSTVVRVVATAILSEDADTLSASIGTPLLEVQLSVQEDNDTLSSASNVYIRVQSNTQEADDTLTGSAAVKIIAAANTNETSDVMVSVTQVRIAGQASLSLADDVIESSAAVKIAAQAALNISDDTLVSTALVSISVQASLSEDDDALISSSSAAIDITSNLTEDEDTLNSTALAKNFTSLYAVEEDDILSASLLAKISLTADLVIDDDFTADATVSITLEALLQEDDDTLFAHIGAPIVTPLRRTIVLVTPVNTQVTFTLTSSNVSLIAATATDISLTIPASQALVLMPSVSKTITFGQSAPRGIEL